MPSQEFYSILEMIIYPDVLEPETLREEVKQHDKAKHASCCAGLPSHDIISSN